MISDYDFPAAGWRADKFADFLPNPDAGRARQFVLLAAERRVPARSRPIFRVGGQQPREQGQPAVGDRSRIPSITCRGELLIGQALFIYWPASLNKVPYLNIPFPLFPNFKEMGFVR